VGVLVDLLTPLIGSIMHLSFIRIIKVNEPRSGIARLSGKPYTMQDCECLLLDETGVPHAVGVLMLPKDLTGKVAAGDYAASFTLGTDSDRKIVARVVELRPVKIEAGRIVSVPPVKAAA